MANLTKAQLADRVLEKLRVKAAGQSARAEDKSLAEQAIDSAHAELRKRGLVPFATSAIPEWAQRPLIAWVAAEISEEFGKQMGEADKEMRKSVAERRLEKHVSGYRHPIPIVAEYF